MRGEAISINERDLRDPQFDRLALSKEEIKFKNYGFKYPKYNEEMAKMKKNNEKRKKQ